MKKTLTGLLVLLFIPTFLIAQKTESLKGEYKLLDFKPLDGCVLTLNQLDNAFYLELDSADQHLAHYPLPLKKAASIYFDCTNAPYIIASDSTYQFTLINGKFEVVHAQSRSDFYQYIGPCLASFDGRIMLESFQLVDSTYEISMYSGEETRSVFSRTVEVEVLSSAASSKPVSRSDYVNGFQRSLRNQNRTENQINSNVYYSNNQSDLVQSPSQPAGVSGFNSSSNRIKNPHFSSSSTKYSYELTRPLVSTLQIGNFIAVIDRGTDSVFVLDHFGYLLSSKPFSFAGKWNNVASDPATGELYVCLTEDGENSIYRLDPFTGGMLHIVDLDEEIDIKQMQFYDGHMYVTETDQQGTSIVASSMH